MSAGEHASVPQPDLRMVAIGELSTRTGVPASTLRYYDELGLVPPAARIAGRRRYGLSSVRDAALVVYLRDVGFTLREIKQFVSGGRQERLDLIERKVEDLVQQKHRIQVALDILGHGQVCPADDHLNCPRFWRIIEDHQRGLSVEGGHARAH